MSARSDGYGGYTVGPSGGTYDSITREGSTDRLTAALEIACRVHHGQTDKGGAPYIEHILAVREAVRPHGEEAMVAATLHDAIEDFEGSAMDRLRLQDEIWAVVGSRVYSVIERLTRLPSDDYHADYIERVAEDWIARVVKIADLTHNMDPRRIPAGQIVDKDFARWDKYRRALIRLERD